MEKKCSYCGNNLNKEELESPYKDEDNDLICDTCYDDNFMNICSLCEDSYEKPTCPEQTFFVVAKEVSKECQVEPGFYKVLSWPYWIGATGFGFEALFTNSIELIKSADINSMLKKMYGKNHNDFGADEICEYCFEKYTKPKYNRINYCDPWYKIHRNIYERGIIKQGY